MKRNRIDSSRRLRRLLAGTALLAVNGMAFAQGLDYSGSIRAGVSNSDNIFLQPSGAEMDETIYSISPSIDLDYANQRIDSSIRYRFDWYRYSDLSTTNRYHRYDARLNGQIVPETLYLEVGGTRSQSLKDPDAIIPADGLPISNNLADRDEYYVQPALEKTFGGSVTVNARYRFTDIRFDRSDFDEVEFIQDNTNQTASFQVENYRRERGLTWALGYEWRETEYDESFPWEFRKATGELGAWVNGKTRIFASGGKESPWDDLIDRSLQDEFWEAGFAFKSGEKVSAEFAAGERSFGTSWRGQLHVGFRRGSLDFEYAERPTTNGFSRFSRGNLFNPDEPDDFLIRPGDAERFVSERGQATLRIDLRRTSLGFVIYDEMRSGRFGADGTPRPDISQSGASVFVSWKAGVRTSLSARGALNNFETETGEQDHISAIFAVDYRLGRRLGLALAYNYSEQDAKRNPSTRSYVANVVSFFVTFSL